MLFSRFPMRTSTHSRPRGESHPESVHHNVASRAARARQAMIRNRRLLWAPLAIAAAVIFAIVAVARRSADEYARTHPPGSYATFDAAVAKFDDMQNHFEPNVPSSSPQEIAAAYRDAGMPDHLWNFERAGMKLVGGRLSTLPSGQRAAYTLYQGTGGSVMCIFIATPELQDLSGGLHAAISQSVQRTFYAYKGHSICYTVIPGGKCVSLLVSREPLEKLVSDVVLASG
jgi:hypothetical protein